MVIAKPDIDTRFGLSKVASRAGLHAEADLVLAPDTVLKVEDFKGVACLLVDEVQFLPPEQIDVFRAIANAGTPVIAFGLRTDFRSQVTFQYSATRREALRLVAVKLEPLTHPFFLFFPRVRTYMYA